MAGAATGQSQPLSGEHFTAHQPGLQTRFHDFSVKVHGIILTRFHEAVRIKVLQDVRVFQCAEVDVEILVGDGGHEHGSSAKDDTAEVESSVTRENQDALIQFGGFPNEQLSEFFGRPVAQEALQG